MNDGAREGAGIEATSPCNCSGVGTTGAAGAGAPISFQLGGAAIEYSPPIIIAGMCAN